MGYQFLEPGQISIHDDRWLTHPWGVNGGLPGGRSTKLMVRADGSIGTALMWVDWDGEHLIVNTSNAEAIADQIVNAGSVFIGNLSPEAIGDYVAGPNHVLPTARTARFSSGLNLLDFMKRTSILKLDAAGLRALAPHAVTLARAEGLEAHARSISVRLGST